MNVVIGLILSIIGLTVYAEEIKYEIYEAGSGELIASGVKTYSKNDVIHKPYTKNGRSIVEKFIELEGGYKVGSRIFPENQLTGFGLVAEKTSSDFSWEWFNQVEGRTFKKLQGEKGLVEIRISYLPGIEVLEEVKFLDDAYLSFRLGGAEYPESHNILVKKGSVLRFD